MSQNDIPINTLTDNLAVQDPHQHTALSTHSKNKITINTLEKQNITLLKTKDYDQRTQ